MRGLALALAFALVATGLPLGTARAETVADARLKPLRYDPQVLETARRRAAWKRNTGIGLAIPGVALVILGSVLIVNGSRSVNLFGGGAQIASGAVMDGLGVALGIPGIVLWVTGQDDLDVVAWRKKQQSAAVGSTTTLLDLRF